MSVEGKLNQVLTNQATILSNQATTLTAIQAITPGGSQAITDALAQIETQVSSIQATIGTDTDGATPAPSPVPDAAPTPAPAA